MKTTMLFVVACGLVTSPACEFEDPEDTGSSETFIQEGDYGSPGGQGLGLSDADCTFTFLSDNVAVTTPDCALRTKTVSVDGKTRKIRGLHTVINGNRDMAKGAIVGVSFRGRFANVRTRRRRFDPTPLQPGEHLDCWGYSGGVPTHGLFVVGDAAGRSVALIEASSYGRLPVAVTKRDLGGYCVRDGSDAPAALLTGVSVGGTPIRGASTLVGSVATGLRLDDLVRGSHGIGSIGEVIEHGAIRLVDSTASSRLTSALGTEDVTMAGAAGDERSQGFYRHPVAKGGGYLYRLVDALTGECVTIASSLVRMQSCDSSKTQLFHENVVYKNNRDRYSYFFGGEAFDYASSPVTATPWAQTPTQEFVMWLAPY